MCKCSWQKSNLRSIRRRGEEVGVLISISFSALACASQVRWGKVTRGSHTCPTPSNGSRVMVVYRHNISDWVLHLLTRLQCRSQSLPVWSIQCKSSFNSLPFLKEFLSVILTNCFCLLFRYVISERSFLQTRVTIVSFKLIWGKMILNRNKIAEGSSSLFLLESGTNCS